MKLILENWRKFLKETIGDSENPESVIFDEEETEEGITLKLQLHPDDKVRIIGRSGQDDPPDTWNNASKVCIASRRDLERTGKILTNFDVPSIVSIT